LRAIRLSINDVVLLTPDKIFDQRGFFSETYNQDRYAGFGVTETFVQDNHSLSKDSYVIRGLHFQTPPYAQGKLIRVIVGSIFDVAVDIRHDSPTFGQHVSAKLSAENWHQLWIPKGFAHGFCTLEENTQVQYKVTKYYTPDHEEGITYNDPELGIDWPIPEGIDPILSDKDSSQQPFSKLPAHFSLASTGDDKR